uniref:Uncharacterized protein n=1 Tax=Anguilla anguilla TaxID=7936 RepID=A0A0E9UCF5_ANGAN
MKMSECKMTAYITLFHYYTPYTQNTVFFSSLECGRSVVPLFSPAGVKYNIMGQ